MAETEYLIKDLYQIEEQYYINKIPLKTIIREAVHAYAKEPYQNIIINDLDDYGLEQLTYKGDKRLLALRSYETGHFTQLFFEGQNDDLDLIIQANNFVKDTLTLDMLTTNDATKVYYSKDINTNTVHWLLGENGGNCFTIAVFEFGDDIGYRITDLTYAGDLISGIGDTIVTILDKIKTMLGDFEYFYDVDGRFIFQRKPNYVNVAWSQFTNNEDEEYVTFGNDRKRFTYSFEGNRIVTAVQNTPVLTNVRNDFIVWGKRKSATGADLPIHARYVIDRKPICYMTLGGVLFYTDKAVEIADSLFYGPLIRDIEQYGPNLSIGIKVDWRELIYQMAVDYFAAQGATEEKAIRVLQVRKDYETNKVKLDDGTIFVPGTEQEYRHQLFQDSDSIIALYKPDEFLYYVGQNNPDFYHTGYTGYEQYYTDMEGFWRQLYNPEYEYDEVYDEGYYEIVPVRAGDNSAFYVKRKQWVERQLVRFETEYYMNPNLISKFSTDFEEHEELMQRISKYMIDPADVSIDYPERIYWNINVFEKPEVLNFWIDFLDDVNELASFSVKAIGDRTKVLNEDKVTSIIFKEIPDVILCPRLDSTSVDSDEDISHWKCDSSEIRNEIGQETGYTFIYIPRSYLPYFDMSYRNTSAKNKIDDLIFQYAYCIENISITTIPVYSLQPNARIYVRDGLSKINGEYIVSKYNVSLAYNGTMSITATKAPERLY